MLDLSKWLPEKHQPNARPSSEIFYDAMRELAKPFPSTPLTGFPTLNKLMGGFRPFEFSILCGATGCLSGDTKIRINRAKKGGSITLKDLYLRWNGIAQNRCFDKTIPTFVRSYNGHSVGLHKIKDVFLSGIKETWRVKLSDLKDIRCTPTHKILTESGWVLAKDLKPGDKVAIDNHLPRKRGTVASKPYDTYYGNIVFHPFKTGLSRLVVHRAVYEAKINNLSLKEFLVAVRSDKEKASKLSYVNPKTHHIHHKNHDHYDNSPDNLEALSISDHYSHHGDNSNFNQGTVRYSKFKGFDRIGVEAVYDISCEDPHHNFAANSIIVHNSGKTTLMADWSAALIKDAVPHFVASVETGATDFVKRQISAIQGEDWNQGDAVSVDILRSFTAKHRGLFDADSCHLSLYDNRFPVETLMADIAWHHNNKGAKIAIVDNLNFFMEVTSTADVVKEMDRVIHELIIFSKQVPVHVVMVMHPRKTLNGRVESEFDIKGSSTAVQEAHNIFLFNRPHNDRIKDGSMNIFDREFTIAKMRRKGKYVRTTLILKNINGVKYEEGGTF